MTPPPKPDSDAIDPLVWVVVALAVVLVIVLNGRERRDRHKEIRSHLRALNDLLEEEWGEGGR